MEFSYLNCYSDIFFNELLVKRYQSVAINVFYFNQPILLLFNLTVFRVNGKLFSGSNKIFPSIFEAFSIHLTLIYLILVSTI